LCHFGGQVEARYSKELASNCKSEEGLVSKHNEEWIELKVSLLEHLKWILELIQQHPFEDLDRHRIMQLIAKVAVEYLAYRWNIKSYGRRTKADIVCRLLIDIIELSLLEPNLEFIAELTHSILVLLPNREFLAEPVAGMICNTFATNGYCTVMFLEAITTKIREHGEATTSTKFDKTSASNQIGNVPNFTKLTSIASYLLVLEELSRLLPVLIVPKLELLQTVFLFGNAQNRKTMLSIVATVALSGDVGSALKETCFAIICNRLHDKDAYVRAKSLEVIGQISHLFEFNPQIYVSKDIVVKLTPQNAVQLCLTDKAKTVKSCAISTLRVLTLHLLYYYEVSLLPF
jgi:hypothetical protein